MLFTATALVSVLFALLVLQAHGIFEEQVPMLYVTRRL